MLASASIDDTVRLWDTAAGKTLQPEKNWSSLLQTLEGHTGPLTAIAFSQDGTMLVSASISGIVQLWDTATGNARQTLKGHTRSVNAIAFSPDGTMLASASNDGTVRLWDTATGNTRQILEGHTGPVKAIAFSRDRIMLTTDRGRI
jgi:WD40 repeat protein